MTNTPGTTNERKNGMKNNAIEATEIASKAVLEAARAWKYTTFSSAFCQAISAKRKTTDAKCDAEGIAAAYSKAAAAFLEAAARAKFAAEEYTRTAEALRAAAFAHDGV